jgi:hypothetical protein
MPLNDTFAALDPAPPLQVIVITMFPENPTSDGLRDSILPNGADAAGHPLGVAVGALSHSSAPDKRIPAVSSAAPVVS